MMKYLTLIFAVLVGAFSCVYAQATKSAAASQAWVENYVSNYVANTKSEAIATTTTTETDTHVTISVGDGVLTMEKSTDAALMVTNVSAGAALGIKSGIVAVWNGKGKYICPSCIIESSATNLIYQGVASIMQNGLLHFEGWFDAKPILIQPTRSHSITNAMENVQ